MTLESDAYMRHHARPVTIRPLLTELLQTLSVEHS